jgi:hypothetical protein
MNLREHALRTHEHDAVPRSVDSVLKGPGRALDYGTRTMMEARFGRSLAHVRVHTDSHAAASARSISAAAYTAGAHIVFGPNRFDPHTQAGRHLLAHELTHVIQQRDGPSRIEGIGRADDAQEAEADRVADAVAMQGRSVGSMQFAVGRDVLLPTANCELPTDRDVLLPTANCELPTDRDVLLPTANCELPTDRVIRRQREDDAPATEQERQPLIVDDSTTPSPDQMQRAAFVDELDIAICTTADAEMARLGRSTRGCPLLEQWRPRIRAMDARTLETSLRRWADNPDAVRTARDYIPAVTRRLERSIAFWGATGRIVGIPPDLMDLLGGGGMSINIGSVVRGAIGRLFRKARDGAAAPSNATPVMLDGGTPLDASTASRMNSAFGRDFTNVRVHTGAEASTAASALRARAFTVGEDIAFANGEYRPGTILGDALLAHELAHVAQQDGATELSTKSESATGALEHDADDAAVHAVASLWPSVRRYARGLRTNAMPRLKSSLQLQRCDHTAEFTLNPQERGAGAGLQADTRDTGCTAEERFPPGIKAMPACCTGKMVREIQGLYPEAIARVRNAVAMTTPEQAGHFDDPLRAHFGITSSDVNAVRTIHDNLAALLGAMQGSGVIVACRSRFTDGSCQHRTRAGLLTDFNLGTSGGCDNVQPTSISFCGDYEESLPMNAVAGPNQNAAAPQWRDRAPGTWPGEPQPRGLEPRELRGRNAPFLYAREGRPSPYTGETPSNPWVQVLIHEYAHTLCARSAFHETPIMQRSETETYRGGTNYPPRAPQPGAPNPALDNPDSYAWFAFDVTRRRQ